VVFRLVVFRLVVFRLVVFRLVVFRLAFFRAQARTRRCHRAPRRVDWGRRGT
jgi:hypothetical protein